MDNGNDRLPFDPGEERLDVINENLSLISRKRGLTFGTDSYLLAAFARAVPSGRAAELGCGTGVASLLCAQKGKYSFVTAAEIQEKYADLARRNVELNGLKDKIAVVRADVRDLTEKDTGGPCDGVFANPPYMKSGAGKANDEDMMYDALELLSEFRSRQALWYAQACLAYQHYEQEENWNMTKNILNNSLSKFPTPDDYRHIRILHNIWTLDE